MIKTDYYVLDDFKARKLYENAIFYSKDKTHTDAEIIKSTADKDNRWTQDIIEFIDLKTKARLKLYIYPKIPNNKGLPTHALQINFSGEEQEIEPSKRKLETITGIKI